MGAFPDARKRLAETKLDQYLHKAQSENRPLLGICLGMQLLFEQSDEVTSTEGLGFSRGALNALVVSGWPSIPSATYGLE